MNKKLFCDTMYYMFKEGNLPDLDMEDFQVMWVALAEEWKLVDERWKENWADFIDEINCRASDDYIWFIDIFNKYFINED